MSGRAPQTFAKSPSDLVQYVPDTIAAQFIGSTPATLRRWRHEGRYLRYYKVGSSVRYKVSELEDFLSRRVVEVRDTAQPLDVE